MPFLTFAAIALSLAQQPAFEVASVRQYKGSGHRNGPLEAKSPLIRLQGYTVFGLVLDAYHLRDFQLDFGKARPEDIADTMYDISARAPGDGVPRLSDVRAMLRTLLEDRFKLHVTRELKERTVYALGTSKTGPRLKSAAAPAEGSCVWRGELAADKRNSDETFTNCPIERLADRITNLLLEPVLDETDLTGRYDFRLLAVPEFRTQSGPDPTDISPIAAVGELGLKLVRKKAMVEVLTIDHFDRPAEN